MEKKNNYWSNHVFGYIKTDYRNVSKYKNGAREEFNREKVLRGVMRAAEKRPVAMDEIQNIVDQVETKIRAVGGNEVSSQLIGEYVMDILANVDDIAYIRFASVYREFKDMASFAKELQDLMARDNEKNK